MTLDRQNNEVNVSYILTLPCSSRHKVPHICSSSVPESHISFHFTFMTHRFRVTAHSETSAPYNPNDIEDYKVQITLRFVPR